jgi:gliding motility-associated-like protein
MKRILLLAISILCFQWSFGQSITVSNDTTICSSQTVTLNASFSGIGNSTTDYTVNSIPFAPEPYLGTTVTLFDDDTDGPFNIGFDFCFFGNTYNQFHIGSNGWISFDAGQPTGFNATTIPNNALAPVNSILGPWSDWNPGNGGTVMYQTTGVAPNRKLVVSWDNVPLYGAGCGQLGKFQIVLNETTNSIENYLNDKPTCPNGGGASGGSDTATQGIQNQTGTVAYWVTGRNKTSWTATNEGWEFVPNGTTPTISWYNGATFLGNGNSINVTPSSTTTYTAEIQECAFTISDDVTVNISDLNLSTTHTDALCNGSSDGTITVTPTGTGSPWDVYWADQNFSVIQTDIGINNSSTVNNLAAGVYYALVTDAAGCMDTITDLVSQPLAITINNTVVNPSCFGIPNGSITSAVAGGVCASGNYNPNWTGPNGYSATAQNITGLEEGTYTITVTDDNGCTNSETEVLTQPSQLIINLENVDAVSCFGYQDGAIDISCIGGTPPYNYSWTGPNGFTDNTEDLNNLFQGNYTLALSDNNNCQAILNVTVGEKGLLTNTFVKTYFNGYEVSCYGYKDGIVETSTLGGNPPYVYRWLDPKGDTLKGANISNLGAGVYTLVVTDDLGCATSDTLELTQPTPLIAFLENHQDITCHYTKDGFIETNTWGSVSLDSTYSFHWTGPAYFSSNKADIYDLSEPGLYTLRVEDHNACFDTIQYNLKRPPLLKAQYYTLNDTLSHNYPFANFYDRSLGDPVKWRWTFSDSTGITYAQDHLNHHFLEMGVYDLQLYIENSNECADSTTGRIKVEDEHTMYVPNAFTPDKDIKNDKFKVEHHALRVDTYILNIYDRFGSLVYSTTDPDAEWDGSHYKTGSDLITGVYTYYLQYQDFEGWIYDHTNCDHCTGTITLIR